MTSASRAGAFTLLVEKGPSCGTVVPIAPGQRLVIGRRPGVDLTLADDEFVSPEHAEIHYGDQGLRLRNHSSNGTLLNGRPVVDTPLSVDDRISIGLVHRLRVAATQSAEPSGAPAAATGTTATTRPSRLSLARRLPWWLAVYLIALAFAGAYFGVAKLRQSSTGLADVRARERQYVAERGLSGADTDRLLRLIDTAVVHEKRGDIRSAYEAYREALATRQPVEPRSPAYRYAAQRMSSLRMP